MANQIGLAPTWTFTVQRHTEVLQSQSTDPDIKRQAVRELLELVTSYERLTFRLTNLRVENDRLRERIDRMLETESQEEVKAQTFGSLLHRGHVSDPYTRCEFRHHRGEGEMANQIGLAPTWSFTVKVYTEVLQTAGADPDVKRTAVRHLIELARSYGQLDRRLVDLQTENEQLKTRIHDLLEKESEENEQLR